MSCRLRVVESHRGGFAINWNIVKTTLYFNFSLHRKSVILDKSNNCEEQTFFLVRPLAYCSFLGKQSNKINFLDWIIF